MESLHVFRLFTLCAVLSLDGPQASGAGELPTKNDDRLTATFQSGRVWNGVATTRDGRVFVSHPGLDGPDVQAEEMTPGHPARPYPDAGWNGWKPGQDFSHAFVQVNALRIGPEGDLWIIDADTPGTGQPALPGAGRIVRIDLQTDRVARVYSLAKAVQPRSYIDGLRFHNDKGYLTDAGTPGGTIVLDFQSGEARRLLDGDPSVTGRRPAHADQRLLVDEKGKEIHLNADQLEVSPDPPLAKGTPALAYQP